MQSESITRRFGALARRRVASLRDVARHRWPGGRLWRAAVTAFIGMSAFTVGAGQARFEDAPAYLPLFAPRLQREAYRIAVSPMGLDDVLASYAGDESLLRAPGAWQPRPEAPGDAFGSGGDYNLWILTRLYGGTQPRVARGPRLENGRVRESWILVSPYPDVSMTRLEPGTLLIVVKIPPL